MSIVARIGQKDDGKTWLAACISTIAMAPKEDRLSVLKAQAAEGAQIINFGLLEKQTVVDRFAGIFFPPGDFRGNQTTQKHSDNRHFGDS
jgi:hypothetical protein